MPDATLSATNLIPENVPLWTESMLWDKQVTVSSGLGYNDNVLLSSLATRGSTFVINEVDLLVMRLPLDGWEFVGSLIGDDIRYWHNVGTDREDTFAASLKLEHDLPWAWKLGFETRGLYEDQVLDISTEAGIPTTALVEGFAVTGQPYARKQLIGNSWLNVAIPVTRWWFATPLDDEWEYGPVVTVGYDFGERGDVAVSYAADYQYHQSWMADDQYDLPIPNQKLEVFQSRYEAAWHQYWDTHKHWRSTSRLAYLDSKDNGGGFFNNDEYLAGEELRFEAGGWKLIAGAQITYQDYPVQKISPHKSDTLFRNQWSVSFEANRSLFKGVGVYGKIEYQRVVSNEALFPSDYRATIASGGVRWSF